MGTSKKTVISLCCGAGGSSLGYQLSGFHELLGIDINSIPCQTFQQNFSLTPVWNRDRSTVEIEKVQEYLELETGHWMYLIISLLLKDCLAVVPGMSKTRETTYFWKQSDVLKVLDPKYS